MRVAAALILGGKRNALVASHILPSLVAQGFDEVFLVGQYEGDLQGATLLSVAPFLHNTQDALIKRDVAALAAHSDVLFYLADDHRPYKSTFGATLRSFYDTHNWDVLVPQRLTVRYENVIPLNTGFLEGYVAGHGMLVRKSLIQQVPWTTTTPRNPWWDVEHSKALRAQGAQFVLAPTLHIEDVEHLVNPKSEPWR